MESSGACNGLNFVDKCEESQTMCEAVFATNGDTCDTHCQSLGMVCKEAWDEQLKTCDSKLVDDNRREGNGCGMGYEFQICQCTDETGKSIMRYT